MGNAGGNGGKELLPFFFLFLFFSTKRKGVVLRVQSRCKKKGKLWLEIFWGWDPGMMILPSLYTKGFKMHYA